MAAVAVGSAAAASVGVAGSAGAAAASAAAVPVRVGRGPLLSSAIWVAGGVTVSYVDGRERLSTGAALVLGPLRGSAGMALDCEANELVDER